MCQQDWRPRATSGNKLSRQLNTDRGIDPYVSLCMTRNHRISYLAKCDGRLPDLRCLAIELEALEIKGTRITFEVANSKMSKSSRCPTPFHNSTPKYYIPEPTGPTQRSKIGCRLLKSLKCWCPMPSLEN